MQMLGLVVVCIFSKYVGNTPPLPWTSDVTNIYDHKRGLEERLREFDCAFWRLDVYAHEAAMERQVRWIWLNNDVFW